MLYRKILLIIITGIVYLGAATGILAAELDIKSLLVCDPEYMQVCENDDLTCDRVEVVDVLGNQTIHVDLKKMLVTTYIDKEVVSSSKIDQIKNIDHQVYLHGTNPNAAISVSGTVWVAKIGKSSGKFTVAVLGDVTGYFMFGVCRNQ